MRTELTTDLVGQEVLFTDHMTNLGNKGKKGTIRSVFLDEDRNPKYSVEVQANNRLFECYGFQFTVLQSRPKL